MVSKTPTIKEVKRNKSAKFILEKKLLLERATSGDKVAVCRARKKVRKAAQALMGVTFDQFDKDAILGAIRDHKVGFALIKGLLGQLTRNQLYKWFKDLEEETLFDHLQPEDANYGVPSPEGDKHARFIYSDVGEVPEGLLSENLHALLAALGYEVHGNIIGIRSRGMKNPTHQKFHCDHPPRTSWGKGFFARSDEKLPPLSCLMSLQGMTLDIYATDEHLRREQLDVPVHPFARAATTVIMEPGDVILFRYDLYHAGRGYRKENIRLFASARALKGKQEFAKNETWVPMCSCQMEILERYRAAKKRKELVDPPNFNCICSEIERLKRGYVVGQCPGCSAWACSCPNRRDPPIEERVKFKDWAVGKTPMVFNL